MRILERNGGFILNKNYTLKPIIYILGISSVLINLLLEINLVLGLLNPLQKDALLIISSLIFIPIVFSLLALFYKNQFFMYGAFVFSIPLGFYLLVGNGIIRIFGMSQFLYLITAIFMTVNIKKQKKESISKR